MNRDHLVVKQSSVTNVWQSDAASWQFPQSHTPVARLSMALAGFTRAGQLVDAGWEGRLRPSFLSRRESGAPRVRHRVTGDDLLIPCFARKDPESAALQPTAGSVLRCLEVAGT